MIDRATQVSAIGADQGVEPPDTQIAVGEIPISTGQVPLMEAVNSSGSVWDKATGTRLAITDFNVLFGIQSGDGFTDPRVVYDASTQRWFLSGLEFSPTTGNSTVLLLVSKTSDPTQSWSEYAIQSKAGVIQDQPKLGVTSDKLLMSWNDFNPSLPPSNQFVGSEAVVLQKSDAVAGTTLRVAALGASSDWFNLIPVQVDDASGSADFVYNVYDPTTGTSIGALDLVSIAGTPATTVSTVELRVAITPTSVPPGAQQPGTGAPTIATNDDSFITAALDNGILWVAGNDGCLPNDAIERSCVRAIELSVTSLSAALLQDVDLGQSGAHFYFPAVSFDTSGNMAMVFTFSSLTTYASLSTTGAAAATTGSFARQLTVATGAGTYNCGSNCSTGFNGDRWGDYSAAVRDPGTGNVWVAGEYAPSSSDATDWGTGAAQLGFSSSVLKTAVSTSQYRLDNSDGVMWSVMDANQLALTLAPASSGTAILDANADLWTANAGINQDIGIFVQTNGGPDTLVAWKESGGYAGTFSPNAAYVQHVMPVSAGSTYRISLRWKSNKPANGTSIFAGAGPIAGVFSPTRLTARLVEGTSSALSAVSTTQYIRSSGTNWLDMDGSLLGLDVPATPNDVAVISANSDLWTVDAGFNQDLGLNLTGGTYGSGQIVAWKESGGFAGTFSPNAAFVQTVVDASSGFHVSLQWRTNINTAGGQIRAGAGTGPWSPTRLTVELVPASSVFTAVSAPTSQYQLQSSNGSSWTAMDATTLTVNALPTADCVAVVSVNVDLWTATAGVNQDVALSLTSHATGVVPVPYWPPVIAWKESGGNAGTFSPNAAFLEAVVPMPANNGQYTLTVEWKANIPTSGTIFAAAGTSPNFSPTRLTAQLICS